MEITETHRSVDLPEIWDDLALDYFQTREFLEHTEKYNPCKQRYFMLFHKGTLITGLVLYTIRLDLFTYLAIPSPFQMNIVGIPCSVSAAGIIGSYPNLSTLLSHIKGKQKGFLLVLNLNSKPTVKDFIPGRTLPTILLEDRFDSWEDYIQSLRSDYRHRINNVSRSFSGIKITRGECADFNEQMYDLYLGVLKSSKGKLETLSMEFFQKLPSNFQLTTCRDQEKVIGWFITTIFREKSCFFLGGIDYKLNELYQTYFNMLIEILREAIEKKASCLDLGQTAEIPKIRMGGKIKEKFMLGYHSNRLIRKLLEVGKSLLEYDTIVPDAHVFREML